jgi:hypothetical protein
MRLSEAQKFLAVAVRTILTFNLSILLLYGSACLLCAATDSAAQAKPAEYSYTYNSLYDPMEWVFTSSNTRPCVVARQPFGLITIANADAAASPHTDAAILEAHWAVGEVINRRAMPLLG